MKQIPSLIQVSTEEWITASHYSFRFQDKLVEIPVGYKFDMASIPRMLWPFVGKHELGVTPTLIHDYLYEHKGCLIACDYTRKEADERFFQEMKAIGISRIVRNIAYRAVRLFGWTYWNREG